MDQQKRYRTMNAFLRDRFGEKVFKVPLNAGFTCPNKDGTKGTGGCTFCSPSGSGDFAGEKEDSFDVQYQQVKTRLNQKWPNAKTIVYFQANTNTYGDVETLRTMYEAALSLDDDIVGIAIATRADALGEDVLDLLEALSTRTFVQVEIGLQSMHEKTARKINRGHDLKTFDQAIHALTSRGIFTAVHIINGFPWEDETMMLDTLTHVNNLGVDAIKIHMLHITKNTAMGAAYQREPFALLSLEDYVDITVKQLRRLHPDIVVQRVTGDAVKEDLLAPQWTLKKFVVMNEIDKTMRRLDAFQGDMLSK